MTPGYNPLDNNLEMNAIMVYIFYHSNIPDTFLVYYQLPEKKYKAK